MNAFAHHSFAGSEGPAFQLFSRGITILLSHSYSYWRTRIVEIYSGSEANKGKQEDHGMSVAYTDAWTASMFSTFCVALYSCMRPRVRATMSS